MEVKRRPSRRVRVALGVAVALSALLVVGAAFYWHEGRIPQSRHMGKVTSHGDRNRRWVALTFNGGPNLDWSARIGQLLRDEHVDGTFFVVGQNARGNGAVLRQLADQHHNIGNLGTSAAGSNWLAPWWDDAGATQNIVHDATGKCPAWFRPAHGRHTPFMVRRIHEQGMQAITYAVEARDWQGEPAQSVVSDLMRRVHPGDIVMFHDGLGTNVHRDRSIVTAVLPPLITALRADGYEIVGLDKLLNQAPNQPHC